MDRAADIIPISSRSPRRPPLVLAADPIVQRPVESSKSGWWALASVGAGLALVAGVALARAQQVRSVRSLPAADRVTLYQRTLTDVGTTCTSLESHDGALREHCIGQAQFLTLFPDCDARCQQLVASVLPHARR